MSTFYITVMLGLVAVSGLVLFVRQKLAKLRGSVKQNWAPVQRQLERRNEIIRKIAEMAEGQVGANDPNAIDDVFSLLDTLGSDLALETQVEFENRLTHSVRRLLQVGDSNYELRKNTQYWDAKRYLAEADLAVTQSARFYNVSAKEYNEVRNAVPCVLFAEYLGFGKQPYLATSLTESEAPEFGR